MIFLKISYTEITAGQLKAGTLLFCIFVLQAFSAKTAAHLQRMRTWSLDDEDSKFSSFHRLIANCSEGRGFSSFIHILR